MDINPPCPVPVFHHSPLQAWLAAKFASTKQLAGTLNITSGISLIFAGIKEAVSRVVPFAMLNHMLAHIRWHTTTTRPLQLVESSDCMCAAEII